VGQCKTARLKLLLADAAGVPHDKRVKEHRPRASIRHRFPPAMLDHGDNLPLRIKAAQDFRLAQLDSALAHVIYSYLDRRL
jgi:hypothetical protein